MRTIRIANEELNDTSTHGQDLEAEFDHLVMLASRGDRRAIGAIAVAIGPTLLAAARTGLGGFGQEAEDVLQDFFISLLEGRWRFTPGHGRAMQWMCGVVTGIAHLRRCELERSWGTDREDSEDTG